MNLPLVIEKEGNITFDFLEESKLGHVLIQGPTGSGKSTLLRLWIRNFREAGYPVFIFDPKHVAFADLRKEGVPVAREVDEFAEMLKNIEADPEKPTLVAVDEGADYLYSLESVLFTADFMRKTKGTNVHLVIATQREKVLKIEKIRYLAEHTYRLNDKHVAFPVEIHKKETANKIKRNKKVRF